MISLLTVLVVTITLYVAWARITYWERTEPKLSERSLTPVRWLFCFCDRGRRIEVDLVLHDIAEGNQSSSWATVCEVLSLIRSSVFDMLWNTLQLRQPKYPSVASRMPCHAMVFADDRGRNIPAIESELVANFVRDRVSSRSFMVKACAVLGARGYDRDSAAKVIKDFVERVSTVPHYFISPKWPLSIGGFTDGTFRIGVEKACWRRGIFTKHLVEHELIHCLQLMTSGAEGTAKIRFLTRTCWEIEANHLCPSLLILPCIFSGFVLFPLHFFFFWTF